MKSIPPAAMTVGQIAREHGVSRDRVLYIVRTRHIAPIARAGHFRLFDEQAAALVGAELKKIEQRRSDP